MTTQYYQSLERPDPGDPVYAGWAQDVADRLNGLTSGLQPWAYPLGMTGNDAGSGGSANLAADSGAGGGALLIPMLLSGPIHVGSYSVYQTDVSLARSGEFRLYRDALGEGVFTEVANSGATLSFTPGGGPQTSAEVNGGSGIIVPPGIVYLGLRCTHASNALNVLRGASPGLGNTSFVGDGTQAAFGAEVDAKTDYAPGAQFHFLRVNGFAAGDGADIF